MKIYFPLLSLLLVLNLSCSDLKNSDEIFIRDLDQFLSLIEQGGDFDERVLSQAVNKLHKFSKRFPNHRFSDDAEFVIVSTSFTDDNRGRVEEFMKKYPGETLEEETKEKFGAITGNEVYLPYDLFFMKLSVGKDLRSKNYQSALDKYRHVLEHMDQDDPNLARTKEFISDLIPKIESKLKSGS